MLSLGRQQYTHTTTVNVVVWGDNNIHILPLEPVNVVVWETTSTHTTNNVVYNIHTTTITCQCCSLGRQQYTHIPLLSVWGDNNIHILPLPVNVVVWGDNNIHILPLEPVNVVDNNGETTIYTYYH